MSLCFTTRNSVKLSDLHMSVFHQIWDDSSPISLYFFFFPTVDSYWISLLHMLVGLVLPHRHLSSFSSNLYHYSIVQIGFFLLILLYSWIFSFTNFCPLVELPAKFLFQLLYFMISEFLLVIFYCSSVFIEVPICGNHFCHIFI